MAPQCKEHPTQPCVMYCTVCETLVCLNCIEQIHQGHTFISLNNMILARRNEIRDKHNILEERLIQYSETLSAYQDINVKLEEILGTERQKITARADDLQKKIDTLKERYLIELDESVSKEKQGLTEKELNLKSDISHLEQLLKNNEEDNLDDSMILAYASFSIDLFKEITPFSELNTVSKLEIVPDVDMSQIFGRMQTEVVDSEDADIVEMFSQNLGLTVPADENDVDIVESFSQNLGLTVPSDKNDKDAVDVDSVQVSITPKSSTVKSFKSFRCKKMKKGMGRICVSTFKNIWVSASESKSITMFHEEGSNIKTLPAGFYVYDISVNSKGEVFFTEKGGHTIWKSAVGLWRTSWRFATFDADTITNGITVTDSGQLLVCLQINDPGGKVARLSEIGQVLQEIEFDKNRERMFQFPSFVKQNEENGDMLIIDRRQIIALDKLGNKKFTISEETSQSFEEKNMSFCKGHFLPVDIETTSEGNIILSDYGNDRICMFDKEGQFMKVLLEGIGKPSGISLRSDGTLFVASSNEEILVVTI